MGYGSEGLAAHAKVDWQPIETAPGNRRIFLWLEHGEKGNGELAVGIVVRDDPHAESGPVTGYWTWGGPNSGSDIDEAPTKWAWLPLTPDGEIHG